MKKNQDSIMMKRLALTLVSIFILTTHTRAQHQPANNTLSIKSGVVALKENAQPFLDSLHTGAVASDMQVIVQLYELPDASLKNNFSENGLTLMDYLGSNAYTAILSVGRSQQLSVKNIRSMTSLQPEWKMDDKLQRALSTSGNTIDVAVSFVKTIAKNDILSVLAQHQATITDKKFESANLYEIRIKKQLLTALASESCVKYMTTTARDKALNNDERAATGADILQASGLNSGYDLSGLGVTVGVGDNTPALFNVDTRDRVTNFNCDPPELHGQHVTGTITSKGIMDPKAKGMAPNAKILAHLYNIVWAQTQPMFQDYNMTLTNNSYAAVVNDCSVAGTYDIYSQMLDDYANSYPEVLNIFAAGNDGNNTCAPYPKGYGTVVGIYQTAKNILTVSSLRKPYTEHEGASKGPVRDGRIKPEVVSFGASIYSCDLNDNYQAINGTSMASPGATGAAALLTERYKQLNGNTNPPNALLKALLINGAVDVLNNGPDFISGFGLINVYRSLQMLNNHHYAFNSIVNNTMQNISVNVPPNTAQVKVLLYWNDLSASPLATTTLVNNLDLTVKEPNNTIHHPLILNSNPANVTNVATEGIDNINNVEQVVISNPQAGSYNITVAGTAVPSSSQQYYIVYDFIPVGITIKNPWTSNAIPANEDVTIFWDASDDPNTFTLEYSDNNGSSWNLISNSIPSASKFYTWSVPNNSTSQALLRLKRNNTAQQSTSGIFTINPQPVLQLDPVQCPGYVAFNWNAIPNANSYIIFQKADDDLKAIDTISSTNYILKGVPLNELQYVAVAPIINGKEGCRSKGLRRLPNDGNCTGTISDNDLMPEKILAPQSGREFTTNALTSNETLTAVIRNLDDAVVNNFKLSYNINGGAWQSQNFTNAIPANGTFNANINGLNLATSGTYQITIAVENTSAADPTHSNDTLAVTIKNLINAPVNIGNLFKDDFETSGKTTFTNDLMGITPGEHWDFTNSSDSGRLRTFVEDDITIGGNRSLSMDLLYSLPANQNYLYGTFNLATYDVATTEARLELDYKFHGIPKSQVGNDIFIRGNDQQPWIKFFDFDTSIQEGQINNTSSLSITNALANAGQNFSSSFQIRIGQNDTSAIAANDYGNGLTIDNFKLYSVTNDVQLLSIINPVKFNCGLSANDPVSVKIYNSDNLPQKNVQVFYRFDNGTLVTQVIDSIAPKDTIDFTFNQTISINTYDYHSLDVWLSAANDSYLNNDSILHYTFRAQPVVNTFPYLENFENSDGYWFSEGINNSWQYGHPAAVKINKAASGTNAWGTNLQGNYNNNETSYLYSPCFDLSQIENPMLSFSLATDIENCGSDLCDEAYVEYSEDGIAWNKLGNSGNGTNWYNDATNQIWNEENNIRWRVASQNLPKTSSLKLRFVFKSDVGASREGIAIDDIHIFDLKHPVLDDNTNYQTNGEAANSNDFLSEDQLLAQLFNAENLGKKIITLYKHTSAYYPFAHQYFLPKNFTIQSENNIQDSVIIRLYVTDEDVMRMLSDNSCTECDKPADIYRTGVLKYDDENKTKENGSLLDNFKNTYTFYPYNKISWVPYEKGYYCELAVTSFSEFWFTTNLPQMHSQNLISIYPNPVVNNTLYIAWSSMPNDHLDVTMYDAAGKRIYTYSENATDADNIAKIALPQLAKGIYFLHYKSSSFTGQQKITIN